MGGFIVCGVMLCILGCVGMALLIRMVCPVSREFNRMAKKRQEMLDSGAGDEALYAVTRERMRKWNGFTRALERDQ